MELVLSLIKGLCVFCFFKLSEMCVFIFVFLLMCLEVYSISGIVFGFF